MIIITADDFGKDIKTSDNILKCAVHKRISSASAMVFMEDSERAATLVKGTDLELGLHLNFTAPFTSSNVIPALRHHQQRIIDYLQIHSLTQIIYNPLLVKSFRLVFNAQLEEFERVYKKPPDFYNGHHHMHLCANVLSGKVLPAGARIRGTFTFDTGEKGRLNLWYRKYLNRHILKKYISTNSFFSITPIQDVQRMHAVFARAKNENIELEVHPENEEELVLLLSEPFKDLLDRVQRGYFRQLRKN